MFLQQYDFDIIHKDPETNKNGDVLSRYIPNTNIEGEIEPVINDSQCKY